MEFTLTKPAQLRWGTAQNGKEYVSVQNPQGKWASVFDEESVLTIKQHGLATYTADIEVNGKYTNLKNVRWVQATPRDAKPPNETGLGPALNEKPPHPSNDYHLSIEAVRHNAMTSTLAADFHLPPGEQPTTTWLIEVAKDFERYYLYGN